MDFYHKSVLLRETIEYLGVQPGKQYIDATLGGGGHTRLILDKGGIVLGVDVDQDALTYVQQALKSKNQEINNLTLAKGNFKDIDLIAREQGFDDVAGIVFDLGISSHHVDAGERGFSFQKEAELDMRMDQSLNIKAKDLVNVLSKKELYELFTKLGEERFSKSIVRGIISARQVKPIETTTELAEIINRAVPVKQKKTNPATRVFQALRMAVNDELGVLHEALPKALGLLSGNGRLAVISFHSLEDRIVKREFKAWEDAGLGKMVTKKPIVPSDEEQEENRRSRSAKLRIFEKTIENEYE